MVLGKAYGMHWREVTLSILMKTPKCKVYEYITKLIG